MKTNDAQRDGAKVEIIDLRPGGGDFATDVRHGLTSSPKWLSPRYFYDDLGSILFEAICRLPEYYVTRAEHEILEHHASSIATAASAGRRLRVVELGPGSATKTRYLINAILERQATLDYIAIDIDGVTLRATANTLAAEHDCLHVTGIGGSFEEGLQVVANRPASKDVATLALFLGSTIGNLEPSAQRDILRSIHRILRLGEDALLLGVDLVKSEDALIPAYDDLLGVTAAFNRNLLVRINRELGGTFNLSRFRHQARYDREQQRIEMHLVSTAAQRVAIGALQLEIDLAEGESIHTENSYKFTQTSIESLARDAGLRVGPQWTDRSGLFGDNLLLA